MKRAHIAIARGSTLLEVAIALGIMAMCGLGLINTQLGLSRHAQLAAARERAAFAADAWAEAVRVSGATGAAASERWKTLAVGIVPEGQLASQGATGDAAIASVTWTASPFSSVANASALPRAASCIDTNVPAGRDCIAVAFLR